MRRLASLLVILSPPPVVGCFWDRVIGPGDIEEVIDLGTLGGWESKATDINNQRQVVGWSDTRESGRHAFLWQDGTMTDLGTLEGSNSSFANGINNQGQVVGWSNTGAGEHHAFLWQDGTMTDLGTLGGRWSEAAAINDLGQVVGWSNTGAGEQHAFLWQDGTMTDLGTLGGQSSFAYDINDLGQVVGSTGRNHAFLWHNGTMTDLGEGGAYGINNQGQVVGLSAEQAFLWQSGTMTDLEIDIGDWFPSARAFDINDLGQVVGRSTTEFVHTGTIPAGAVIRHAFLWQDGHSIDLDDGEERSRLYSIAYAINSQGQVVGWRLHDPYEFDCFRSTCYAHATLWVIEAR